MKKKIASVFLIIAVLALFAPGGRASAAEGDYPRVLMSGYRIGDGESDTVSSGLFTLSYTLSNHSASDVVNAVMSYDQRSGYILPAPGSANTAYIGGISAGGQYRGSIELYVPKNAESGLCKFDVTLSYNSADPSVHSLMSTTFSVYINIANNVELALKKAELSGDAAVSGRKRLLVEYENPGSRDFKNLRLFIEGGISEEQKIQILPLLKAEKSNSVEYYVYFTETGERSLNVRIAYDDDDGNSYTTEALSTNTVTVSDGDAVPPAQPDEPSEGYISELIKKLKKQAQTPEFAATAAVLLLVVAAAAALIPRLRTKAKKKSWYYKDKGGNDGNNGNDGDNNKNGG